MLIGIIWTILGIFGWLTGYGLTVRFLGCAGDDDMEVVLFAFWWLVIPIGVLRLFYLFVRGDE